MYKHLTREQRYVVCLELQRKTTQEVIAQLIGASKSTVCREIKRNSTATGKYVRCKAQDMTEHRKRRTPGNRAISPILRWRVEQLIKEEGSVNQHCTKCSLGNLSRLREDVECHHISIVYLYALAM